MFNLDDFTSKNDKIDRPYRALIIGPLGSGKTNYFLNKIQQYDINDKIYLYAKDLEERKCQLLMKKKITSGNEKIKRSSYIY